MFVVTVEFVVKAPHIEQFRKAMLANASASLRDEVGCKQFDIDVDPADDKAIFLYEIYDDQAAFAAHCASAHFKSFDSTVADWVERKTVRLLKRLTT